MLFFTVDLFFTVPLFIYHLVISILIEFSHQSYPWMHNPDNLPIKYHEQKFCIKFAFSGRHWTEISTKKFKKFQLFMCLIKIWISVLNFSTESAKLQNQQFIPCYSSLHFILLKMTNKKHLRWVISTNQSCSLFATHFDDKP